MANLDNPSGFTPVRHQSGGQIHANGYPLASGYATAIYRGDAVVLTSGKLAIGAANSAGLLGIFDGCQYTASDGSIVYSPNWVASTATSGSADAVAFVYDDPNIIYRAQVSTDLAFVLATHSMFLCDLIGTHTGSAISGQSKQEINLNDTSDEQFIVLRLINEAGNAVGAHAKVECKIKDSRTSSTYSA